VGAWTGAIAALVAVIAASTGGLLLRLRNGNFRAASGVPDPVLAQLGVTTGTVTLLQFSSAFCGPCRTTRVLCADVANRLAGVRHLEVDAESNLDAVRALDIWRTPTVLIIDAEGRISRRATGAPSRAQLLAAVDAVLYAPAQSG
jgi:thiol-disulfide isomerase/thioredoxin